MKKFEYTEVGEDGTIRLLDNINTLGRQGWEVINIAHLGNGFYQAWLKREIPSRPTETPLG